MKKVLFFIFLLLIPFVVYGKDLELKWEHNYGGMGYEWWYEFNYSYDKNGNIDGYIVAGYGSSGNVEGLDYGRYEGMEDDEYCYGLIVKYDLNGRIVWHKAIDGYDDMATVEDVLLHYDKNGNIDGYVLIVNNHSNPYLEADNTGSRLDIIQYDLNGNLVYRENIKDKPYVSFNIYYRYDSDNKVVGYYIQASYLKEKISYTTYYYRDIISLDLDLKHHTLFKEQLSDEKELYDSYSADGKHDGYYAHVTERVPNAYHHYIKKYDSNFNELWSYDINNYPAFMLVTQDKNGKYDGLLLSMPYTNSLTKISLNGEVVGSFELDNDTYYIEDAIPTYDKDGKQDGYLFGGSKKISNATNDFDSIVMKYDKDGNFVWENVYGKPGVYDGIYDRTGYDSDHLIMSKDINGKYDGYYVAITESCSNDIDGNAVLMKLDFNGKVVWQEEYGGFKDDTQLDDPRHETWYGWDVVDYLMLSYDMYGRPDGVIYVLPDTSTDWRDIYNGGYMDPVIVKYGLHLPEMSIEVKLDDKDVVTFEKDNTLTYKVLVKNIGNTDSDDNVIKTIIPEGIEIIEDSISDNGTYDKDSRTVTWTYGKMMMGDSKEFYFKVMTQDKLDKNLQFNSVLSSSITTNQESNEVKIIINPITKVGMGVLVIVLFALSAIYIRYYFKRRKISI